MFFLQEKTIMACTKFKDAVKEKSLAIPIDCQENKEPDEGAPSPWTKEEEEQFKETGELFLAFEKHFDECRDCFNYCSTTILISLSKMLGKDTKK